MLPNMPRCGAQTPHASLSHHAGGRTPCMPTWLAVCVFFFLGTAAVWAGIVWLVHLCGRTSGMAVTRESREKEGGRGGGRWTTRLVRGILIAGKKGTKYEMLSGGQEGDGDGDAGTELRSGGLASSRCVSQEEEDFDAQGHSPANPYLLPPGALLRRSVKPRGSVEWADEHRAFFACAESSTSVNSLSSTELEDVKCEAREAQGRRASHMHAAVNESRGREECVSWVDLGLAMVDDTVDKVAAKIVRWTDDSGRDEELVLPIAKGKQH